MIPRSNLIQIQWDNLTNHKLCIKEYQITIINENEKKFRKTFVNGFLLTDLKAGQKYYGSVTAVYNNNTKSENVIENFFTPETCTYNIHNTDFRIIYKFKI